jgi:hypothetical protein
VLRPTAQRIAEPNRKIMCKLLLNPRTSFNKTFLNQETHHTLSGQQDAAAGGLAL